MLAVFYDTAFLWYKHSDTVKAFLFPFNPHCLAFVTSSSISAPTRLTELPSNCAILKLNN